MKKQCKDFPGYTWCCGVIFSGAYFTVARASAALVDPDKYPDAPICIWAEGISKRSGAEDLDTPSQVGKAIAEGRAIKALQLKLHAGKRWVKISNNMMA